MIKLAQIVSEGQQSEGVVEQDLGVVQMHTRLKLMDLAQIVRRNEQ
jgi:hypothetical protein